MSNLVSADGRFEVSPGRVGFAHRSIVIAATDGCFGYVHSPIQFEALLLESVHAAEADGSWEAWQERLESRIVEITRDDATLGLACVGWSAFGNMAGERGSCAGTRWNSRRYAPNSDRSPGWRRG